MHKFTFTMLLLFRVIINKYELLCVQLMKCNLHKTSHPNFQSNEFNRVITSLNKSYIISLQQYVSKDLLKTHQKVSKTSKS